MVNMKLRQNKQCPTLVERSQANNKNILLILTKHQTDNILDVIQKLRKYGYNLTLAFANKFQKKIFEQNELLQKVIEKDIDKIFDERKNKSFTIITDNEVLKEVILKQKPFGNIYIVHTNLPSSFGPQLRNCFSQTNLNEINLTYNYRRKKVDVYKLLKGLPKVCIFFTALGCYRNEYNYGIILKSFYKFLERQDKIFGNPILLVFGGNFNYENCSDSDQIESLYYKIAHKKCARHIVLVHNLSVAEKKAFLRLSYAMLYFNESAGYNFDVKLAMSVGTPLIGVDGGFIRGVVKNEPSCGYLTPMQVDSIASCMYTLTSPTKYQTASKYSRLNYLKNYTKFARELKSIEGQLKGKKQVKKITRNVL